MKMQEPEPEAEASCFEGYEKHRAASGILAASPPPADGGPAGNMHGKDLEDDQDNESMEHLHEDEQEVLYGEWKEGDLFCGFEFEVPVAPDGLEWVPYMFQGRYRLQKTKVLHDDAKMEEID